MTSILKALLSLALLTFAHPALAAGATEIAEVIVPVPTGYTIVRPIATCNGTNITSQLQNAVNVLRSNQALVLPVGNCGSLKNLQIVNKTNVALMGQGREATTIVANSPSSLGTKAQGGIRIMGGNNVLVANIGVRWTDPGKRGTTPWQTCFSATPDANGNRPTNFKFDNTKGQGCKGGGTLIIRGDTGLVQHFLLLKSKADGTHAWASRDITFRQNYLVEPGDDCFASIGGAGSASTNIKFHDSTCRGPEDRPGWGGGCHADNSMGFECLRNYVRRVGASCAAISNDGLWSGNNPTDHSRIEDNIFEACVTRTELGHGSISVYTSNKGFGPLGPDNRIVNNQVRTPASGPAFRQWGPGDKTTVLTGLRACGMGSKPLIRVLTGNLVQADNSATTNCLAIDTSTTAPAAVGERGR